MSPIREWTDEEKANLLTQEQVDALPMGALVLVKWSGGNGPHEYLIQRHHNAPGKVFAGTYWDIEHDHLGHRIDFVGKERPFTQVWVKK